MRSLTFGGRARALVLVLMACALASNATAARAAAEDAAAEDDAALRANVRQLEEGWNAKSGALFARPFAEDADYVVINGLHIRGREAIGRGHQQIFETRFKNSTMSMTVKQVRFLRPDVALVHVAASLSVPETGAWPAVITLVMLKDKAGWKITAFQNTQDTSREQR